ncbi:MULTISPECIES: phosphatase PAP2 family protein [Pseudomonas]|uniref:Phosphoesterase n=1 Tax=Pseudomonas fulva TaxID=47880 RepID=A0A0D0L6B7_9PSED|nr:MULTISPECIES: phosphatase PAP2 family protein [Pseudomonas]KIQ06602.1 phosphoesterase [Pseudomonas fulva]
MQVSYAQPVASRRFDFKRWLGIPLALMALLLVVDPQPLDFALAGLFYDPASGFIGSSSFWLEDVLHDQAKILVIGLGVMCIAAFLLSLLPVKLRAWRRELGYLVLSLSLSTGIVTPLKTLTAVQCPWSLTQFGGRETFSPLIGARPTTDKPGRCWPGGHASAGFSLLALFFALRDRRPRLAKWALAFALALGTVLSLGRMLQGAHFLSHNLWTLLFDWLIAVIGYRALLYRPMPVPRQTPARLQATREGARP